MGRNKQPQGNKRVCFLPAFIYIWNFASRSPRWTFPHASLTKNTCLSLNMLGEKEVIINCLDLSIREDLILRYQLQGAEEDQAESVEF